MEKTNSNRKKVYVVLLDNCVELRANSEDGGMMKRYHIEPHIFGRGKASSASPAIFLGIIRELVYLQSVGVEIIYSDQSSWDVDGDTYKLVNPNFSEDE